MNNELIGVVIDPAHGGIDTGIMQNGLYEKDLVLELSKYIQNRLNELGIDTIMTRNDDTTLSFDERINRIKNTFGDREGILVLSNRLNTPADDTTKIIYSINEQNMDLINNLKEQLEYEGISPISTVIETLPSDNNQNANILQRQLNNADTIVIDYGKIFTNNENQPINEDFYNYGEGIVRGIALNYGIAYEEPNNIKNKTHVVLKGESLYSIAKDYNTTIGAIKAVNNLKNNILSIGQVLKLPNYVNLKEQAEDILIYTVKKGDTLYSIAQNYNLDPNDLIEYNQLFNTLLTIGQQLIIPIFNNNDKPFITYIVNSGDTLYSIAKKYNVNVNELMEFNNLNNNMIGIGEEILIPKSKNYITYFVRTGDTLNSIANKFNTTVENIMQTNNLNTSDVTIGQLLIIDNKNV